MSPIIVILGVAVVIGLVAGGSLRNFERVRVHWWALAFGGVALQALPAPTIAGIEPSDGRHGDARALLRPVARVHHGESLGAAAGVMAVGLLLNLSVVAINGGMPVSTSAIRTAGGSTLALATASDAKHHLMTDEDKLTPLADVIPIPRPAGIVLSIGDELLYTGWPGSWCRSCGDGVGRILGRSRCGSCRIGGSMRRRIGGSRLATGRLLLPHQQRDREPNRDRRSIPDARFRPRTNRHRSSRAHASSPCRSDLRVRAGSC